MSLNSVQSFVIENCNGPTIKNGLNNVCWHPLSRTFAFYLYLERRDDLSLTRSCLITRRTYVLLFLIDVNGHCCVVKTELAAYTLRVQFKISRNRTRCLHVESAVDKKI